VGWVGYPPPPVREGATWLQLRHLISGSEIIAVMRLLHSRGIPRLHLLAVVAMLILAMDLGCAGRTYRASKLPRELMAPPVLNMEALNLSGLVNSSVSVEVIQPGDVLDVSMLNDFAKLTTTTTPVRIGDDGTATVPLVGKVAVGGMSIEQAEQVINSESITRGMFRTPCITVTMKQCRTRAVTVVGAVVKPGTHKLPRGSTSLMAALVAADGLSKEAGTEVEIRHTDTRQAVAGAQPLPQFGGGPPGSVVQASYQQTEPGVMQPTVTKVDLMAVSTGAVQVPELHDGDVVHVATRVMPPVYVIGLVRKPGEYKFPTNQELRVLDAVALAGGMSNPVADEVVVIRKVPGAPEPVRIALNVQNAKDGRENLALAPGDTVSIEQTPLTMTYDVVNTFFRVGIGASVNWF
jgi:polysaccharide biosynthesis/export protein